jgi:hypothetical protein
MKIFYVRPGRLGGYGAGDGSSYENAWNGFKAIDWDAIAGADPATVWVCGPADRPSGFMTVHVEWSYLEENAASNRGVDLETDETGTDTRRESSVAL